MSATLYGCAIPEKPDPFDARVFDKFEGEVRIRLRKLQEAIRMNKVAGDQRERINKEIDQLNRVIAIMEE